MSNALVITFIMSFVLALTTGPASYAQNDVKKGLRVSGATMAIDEVQIWAETYMKRNPGIGVVVGGSTVSKGFDDLFEGDADLVTSGRVPSPEELKKAADKGLSITNRLVGYAALAVITSPRNPINQLTVDQVRRIFIGEYSNWRQVGGPDIPIRFLTRQIPESGDAVFFKLEVLHDQPFGARAAVMNSWDSIVKVCTRGTDLPIGIAPFRAAKGGVKLLGIKLDEKTPEVIPSDETLKNRSYPIINAIRLYWDGRSEDARIRNFVDFCEREGLQIK